MDKTNRMPVFEQVFYSKLVHMIAPFEKKRKLTVVFFLITVTLLAAGLIALAINLDFSEKSAEDAIYLYSFVILLVVLGFVWYLKKISSDTKRKILPIIFKPYNIFYTPDESKENIQEIIECSHIFPSFDDINTDDCFKGNIDGNDFTLQEAKITYTSGSGKNRRTVTVFQGLVFSAGFCKDFSSTTVIKSDKGILNCLESNILKNVKLEDVVFEKHFETYSEDQVEARFLLTTAFMERFLNLKLSHKSSVQAVFLDNKVNIFLSYAGDVFELPYFSTILKPQIYKSIIKKVLELTEIINSLKINEKIGL